VDALATDGDEGRSRLR